MPKRSPSSAPQPASHPGATRRARPHTSRPTLDDLAKIVGVTKVTVSRALNTPGLVSEDTLRRVQEAVRQTGYVPNLAAGSLASSRSRLVVALIPTVSGGVFQESIESMINTFSAHDFRLLLGQSGYEDKEEDALLDEIIGRRPAGIVLTGVIHSDRARERLQASGIPVVETWDLTKTPIDMVVGFSHQALGRAAANYLVRRGGSTLCVFTPDDRRALMRTRSFVETGARQTGQKDIPVYTIASPTSIGDGRRAFARLLAEHPEVDTLFCGDDNLALGVLIEARSRGIAIPAQLRVMGYGDRNFAKDADPPLSTMRIDGTRIGRLAAELLIKRIEGHAADHPVIDVGFELMERETT